MKKMSNKTYYQHLLLFMVLLVLLVTSRIQMQCLQLRVRLMQ